MLARRLLGSRRLRCWLIAAPLFACGCEAAHALGDALAGGGPDPDFELFESTGLLASFVPLLLCGALVLVVLGFGAHAAAGGAPRPGTGRLSLLVVPAPIVAFTLQEEFEHVLGGGRPTVLVLLHWTFLTGLGLQLLFALAAWGLCRLLFGAAEVLHASLRPVHRSLRRRAPMAAWASVECERLAPRERLGTVRRLRGPPRLLKL